MTITAATEIVPSAPHTKPIRTAPRRRTKVLPVAVILSASWLALLVLAAIAQPILPLPDPSRSDYGAIASLPFTPGHILGTDEIGRDMLARVIAGARISLTVGVLAVLVAVVIGAPLGILAGYFSGTTNRVIGVFLDISLAFPSLVALIALSVFLGPSLTTIVIGIGIVSAPAIARVARAATLTYAPREFVTAARGLGAGHLRILVREILPNVVVPVTSYALVLVAVAIIGEASLSFLGLGVPPPTSSWGGMMGTGRSEITRSPHIVLIPAFFMFISLLAINFLAEHFTKRFDIKEASL
ncbi:ABC transporter permease [Microbacterium caowuchunii]|uniref:ABC transporter permease n=1 Tax=Microbacterium caowuchunii TaxID=2614638 RepID=UPI0012472FB3|nr:ABC transporter permease [Microbacterium caowuchunii]QEW01250.1 ABC transporter permease [Microbacterium caowuchunii]